MSIGTIPLMQAMSQSELKLTFIIVDQLEIMKIFDLSPVSAAPPTPVNIND